MRFSSRTSTAAITALLAALCLEHFELQQIHAFSVLRPPSVHGRRPAMMLHLGDMTTTSAVDRLGFDSSNLEEKNKKNEDDTCVQVENPGTTTTKQVAQQQQDVKVTWEPQVADLLIRLEQVSNPARPLMVGIVGIPGSGKSTSAAILQSILASGSSSRRPDDDNRVLIMPMDGFHIPLAELAQYENAKDFIYRRGAPDTFHAAALQQALHQIAYGNDRTVSIPGFDHGVGDPTPNQYTFRRDAHRIVLCEGLYLLHDNDGWENVKSVFDWTIYIDANVDACIARLKERNKCIPVGG
jgi:pantothenate kinase